MSESTSRYVRPSEAMTPAEAAAWLGCHAATLATWRGTGRGPVFVRVGGRIRYREADLIAWVKQQSTRRAA